MSLEEEAAAYPWTADPARNFSGILDHRPPAAVPCWTTRPALLKAIAAALNSETGLTERKKEGGIAADTVLAVAGEDCQTADSSTGRNVMTSHATVVRRLNAQGIKISWGTVRKARRLLRTLGFQVTIEEGRYLTKTERLAYGLANPPKPGSQGRPYIPWRKASTRVFTMTAEAAKATGHLPRRGSKTPNLKKVGSNQKRLRAGSTSPSPTKPKSKAARTAGPRPLGVQKIAARLKQRLGWLSPVRHNNSICDTLMRLGVDPSHWTGSSLVNAINDRSVERGWKVPERISNPLGYLSHLLQDLDPTAAARTHYRESRAASAAKDAQDAKAKLDRIASADHKAELAAGVSKLRAALRAARESSGTVSR